MCLDLTLVTVICTEVRQLQSSNCVLCLRHKYELNMKKKYELNADYPKHFAM